MELRGLHSATPQPGEGEKGGRGGEILQKILQSFHHESLLAANDTILIPLNH